MTVPVSVREPPSTRGSGGWTRPRVVFLAVSSVAIVTLLVCVREVLLPFILALIIAYVLAPLVQRVERFRVPRAAAILIVYAITLGSIYLSIASIAPRIAFESAKFLREAPSLVEKLQAQYGPQLEQWVEGFRNRSRPKAPAEDPAAVTIANKPDGSVEFRVGSGVEVVQQGPGHWRVGPTVHKAEKFKVSDLTARGINEAVSYIQRNGLELLSIGKLVISTVARGIFLLFMTLMVAGYIMATRETILGFFRSLLPARSRISFDRLLWRMDRGLSGVVRGQLLICLVNGVLSAVGYAMFDLKYWPILSIVSGVMSIVPIFGSILSSVPVVLIGLTQDFWTAIWVLLWIVGIHQVEANLLNPKIIGVAAKIHPVLVVLALIIGEHYFGLWGALLAVPVLSILQSIFNHFRFETMPDAPPDSLLPPAGGAARVS
ncbi:MAG: AI-2E family transporter [Myxococcales bacterium]|nr:MAG: AI-2E family transporter [Myxococcales bacterium]